MTDAALRGLLPGVPLVDSPFFARLLPELGFDAETERIARDLHAQGYARIAFPDPELPARASRIRRDLGAGFDLAAWRDGGGRAQAGLRVQDAWTRHDDVRAIAANPDLLALLGRLFGRRAFPFQTLNFPVGTQQHFHADSVHFSSIPEGFMCGIWVALEDVGPEAGPLVYYPGSHRWPRLDNAQIGLRVTGRGEAINQGVYETVWRALVDSSGIAPVPFHARQGEAVIWLANLLHGGSRQMPAHVGCVVRSRKPLQRHDACGQEQRRIEEPGMTTKRHAGGRAYRNQQRIAERGHRETRMQQRANAEDSGREHTQKHCMLGAA